MTIVAAILAIWFTGMIPLVAAEASGALDECDGFERCLIYWFWPIVMLPEDWAQLSGLDQL